MARVRVRIDDLERGDLPALSVKTGDAVREPGRDRVAPGADAVVAARAARSRRSFRWSRRGPGRRRLLTRVTWVLLVAARPRSSPRSPARVRRCCCWPRSSFVAYVALVVIGELRWIGSKPSDHDGRDRAHARAPRLRARRRRAVRPLVGDLGAAELAQPGAEPHGGVVDRVEIGRRIGVRERQLVRDG